MPNTDASKRTPPQLYEAEVVEGLEDIAKREIESLLGRVYFVSYDRKGTLRFQYAGSPYDLLALKTVTAVYTVQFFTIPRPRALLGNQNFFSLLRQIKRIRKLYPAKTFQTLALAAAGSNSSIMQRVKLELKKATGLSGAEEGDLLIRIIPSRNKNATGWETLVRISPRPLVTRSWRQVDMKGALNACVANVMNMIVKPQLTDTYLNLACGSGTLMIERALIGASQRIAGMDNRWEAIQFATQNIMAAGLMEQIELIQGDMRQLPFDDESFTILTADLPFGQLVGSHEENKSLYPATLQEAARVATKGGNFIVITHEVRLMEQSLFQSSQWSVKQTMMINLRGLHPRIFILKRQ